MAGPHPSPWTRLLLAALLSVSFPGHMGESDTPLQHPSWRGLNFQDTALKVAGCGGRLSVLPRPSLSHSTNSHHPLQGLRSHDPELRGPREAQRDLV